MTLDKTNKTSYIALFIKMLDSKIISKLLQQFTALNFPFVIVKIDKKCDEIKNQKFNQLRYLAEYCKHLSLSPFLITIDRFDMFIYYVVVHEELTLTTEYF